MAKARIYTPWEPPKGGERVEGKKIMVDKLAPRATVHQQEGVNE